MTESASGMQLEPVINTSAREIGYRVIRFIDNLLHEMDGISSSSIGKGECEHVGDVNVAVDGINVLSKTYEGIIEAFYFKLKDGSTMYRKGRRLFSEVSKGNSTTTTKSRFI
jgi:hypothetical protein